MSNHALITLSDALRQHRALLGTRWRRLTVGEQALLVVAHLRKGETYTDEIPFFVFMVILNVAIIAVIIDAAIVLPFLPESLKQSGWAVTIRTALIALLVYIPALIVIRETQRAGIRGTAVQLSERQYPELYETVETFAEAIGLRRRPDFFLANGNGALNAFAAQAFGHDYTVLANELFVNLYNNNRNGLRFIIGHELGHIRYHHVALWYQIAVAYSQPIPILGPTLSRLREYSCDRQGAALTPQGATGLVLLASGRYTENTVDIDELVQQGRELHGFWVGLTQLPRSHPFTVRRLERLYTLGLFQSTVPGSVRPNEVRTPDSATA